MNTKEVLIAARALIEQGWTQDAWSRDIKGRVCEANEAPVFWCPDGAIADVLGEDRVYCDSDAVRLLEKIINESYGLITWNDMPDRTKEEVLALFDKAIEACDA